MSSLNLLRQAEKSDEDESELEKNAEMAPSVMYSGLHIEILT